MLPIRAGAVAVETGAAAAAARGGWGAALPALVPPATGSRPSPASVAHIRQSRSSVVSSAGRLLLLLPRALPQSPRRRQQQQRLRQGLLPAPPPHLPPTPTRTRRRPRAAQSGQCGRTRRGPREKRKRRGRRPRLLACLRRCGKTKTPKSLLTSCSWSTCRRSEAGTTRSIVRQCSRRIPRRSAPRRCSPVWR